MIAVNDFMPCLLLLAPIFLWFNRPQLIIPSQTENVRNLGWGCSWDRQTTPVVKNKERTKFGVGVCLKIHTKGSVLSNCNGTLD